MPTIRSVFPSLVGLLLLASSARAAPPRVTRAVPDNGDQNIDPATTEIRIEFDQEMSQTGHSICGGGPEFPEMTTPPHWDGPRTFILSVKLEPEHNYRFSVNCPVGQNFRSAGGEPAERYPIAFKTGKAKADKSGHKTTDQDAAALTPAKNDVALEQLRKAIDDQYSYRELHQVDWDKTFADARPKLIAATTPAGFARELGRMLAVAQDPHISVWVGDAAFPVYQREVRINFNPQSIAKVVPNYKQENECVSTGRFDDGIGYLALNSWGKDCVANLDPAFELLGQRPSAKALIIDVRANGGGDEMLAQQFAGCFLDAPKVYSRSSFRDPKTKDGFTLPQDRVVKPNAARPHFAGKVVVLIGNACMSSNESFILMMRQAGATLIGETTAGSSGNPRPVNLSNGVRVNLPTWIDLMPDGTQLEGHGVKPDVPVKTRPSDFERADPVIEAGLKKIRG